MFEKTLTDVVKGIRASKRDTALFISQCIAEIKTEVTSSDMHVKANALQKLTFLQMMGYSMSWASFATIEVMSSPRFAHKRIAYLAASQGFTQDTEVILLTTNLLQKELRGASITNAKTNQDGVYEAGLAINCISNIVTADLAVDLLPEMTQLTSHPQPYLRKKAILCLFKLFVHYPQGLRLTFGKLQACLQDPNPAVVSCAVNVITELSDKNPRNYLSLAPAFFDLLTGSSNNWMLIKVVKLLGSLVPEEPRLARKLLEPLANIVRTTQAKSLLYEAVHTITLCLPYCAKADGSVPAIVPEIVQLSAQTLRSLVEESDQNLKYLGLVGFSSLMQSHPRVLSSGVSSAGGGEGGAGGDARPLILACLSDPDVTIRKRALDLLMGLATRKNVVDLVSQLMQHVPLARGRGSYRHDLIAKILEICSSDKYALLSDFNSTSGENHFEWYFNHVLLKLGHLLAVHGGGGGGSSSSSSLQKPNSHAQRLHDEIINVALRVLPVRTHAVQRSVEILLWRSHLSEESSASSGSDADRSDSVHGTPSKQHVVMPEILPALAWILGEYSDLLPVALADADLPPLTGGTADGDENNITKIKGPYHAIVQVLSSPWNVQKLSTACQKVYLQAVAKVLAAGSAASASVEPKELEACLITLELNLPIYVQSVDVEVVERAFTVLQLLQALNLTTPDASVPGLMAEEEDDDDLSNVDSGDLLGLDAGAGKATSPELSINTTKSTKAESAASSALGSRIRTASSLLNGLLKPSPMKPISNKAQRKKQQSVLGGSINTDLNAPLDLSVIQSFIDEETTYLTQSKLSLESVSFTQQRPLQPSAQTTGTTAGPGAAMGAEMSTPLGVGGGSTFAGTVESFQNSSVSKQRQSDPFYLDSSPTAPAAPGSGLMSAPSGEEEQQDRFGTTIQLPNDDEYDGKASREQSGGKKHKKAKKKSKSTTADYLNFDPHSTAKESPVAVGNALQPGVSGVTSQAQVQVVSATIFDSEDEEDDDDGDDDGFRKAKQKRKEFSGLSKVDLTRPLGEDEVMPTAHRTHREVVAEVSVEAVDRKNSKKELKKQRKESKKKKKKDRTIAAPVATAAVGDLLDLTMFGDASTAPSAQTTSTPIPQNNNMGQLSTASPSPQDAMGSTSNPITSAFDDLLGLAAAPSAAPVLPSEGFSGVHQQQQPSPAAPMGVDVNSNTVQQQQRSPPQSRKKANRPWIRGHIESSHATGSLSTSTLDWTQVRLTSRTYRSNQGGSVAAMIVVRVENTSGSALTDVVLDLHNFGSIALGNASPAVESQKVGPFHYPQPDTSLEVSGTLRWSGGGSVPVKIWIPATLHLAPQEGLQLEQVAEELASPMEPFSSASTKIEMSNSSSYDASSLSYFENIKQALSGFLRVSPVLETSPNPRAATFAATSSSSGAKLRVLVKRKEKTGTTIKVDFRCTNPSLAKALALDLKKVVF